MIKGVVERQGCLASAFELFILEAVSHVPFKKKMRMKSCCGCYAASQSKSFHVIIGRDGLDTAKIESIRLGMTQREPIVQDQIDQCICQIENRQVFFSHIYGEPANRIDGRVLLNAINGIANRNFFRNVLTHPDGVRRLPVHCRPVCTWNVLPHPDGDP